MDLALNKQQGLICHKTQTTKPTIKQSDGEAPVVLKLWWMYSLPGLLWFWVVAPDRVLSMNQIEQFDI